MTNSLFMVGGRRGGAGREGTSVLSLSGGSKSL